MKIQAKQLLSFVKKASMNGYIQNINMDFKEDGVHSSVKDMMERSLTRTFLRKEAFEGYILMGEIFIKNTKDFLKYLKKFEGVVDVVGMEEHLLTIVNDVRETHLILGAAIVCENVYRGELPILNTTAIAKVSKEELGESLTDMKDLAINKVTLIQDETNLTLIVGEKGESDLNKNKLVVEGSGIAKVSIADSLFGFYEALDGGFTLKMGTDIPIVLIEQTEYIDYTCIIAPIVENE